MKAVYCPHCSDPWDDAPIKLDTSSDGKVAYCSGAYGESPCGFHYEIETGKRFRYVDKRFIGFWMLLCVITLGYVDCQKRVDCASGV